MISPTPTAVAYQAMKDILDAMIKLEDSPCSAEMHLARAVVVLNQFAEVTCFHDTDLTDKLSHCHKLVLGR